MIGAWWRVICGVQPLFWAVLVQPAYLFRSALRKIRCTAAFSVLDHGLDQRLSVGCRQARHHRRPHTRRADLVPHHGWSPWDSASRRSWTAYCQIGGARAVDVVD
jgi:hypothetical protein